MATAMPTMLVLKSSTSMTLNDRFSNLAKMQPVVVPQQIRATFAAQRQEISKNQRLAQQMNNRPAVQAELTDFYIDEPRSLRQRLGNRGSLQHASVKARLSLPRGAYNGNWQNAAGDFNGESLPYGRPYGTIGRGQRSFSAANDGLYSSGRGQMGLGTATRDWRRAGRGRGPSRSSSAVGRGSVTSQRGGRGRAAMLAALSQYYESHGATNGIAVGRSQAGVRGGRQGRGSYGPSIRASAVLRGRGGNYRGYRGVRGRGRGGRSRARGRGYRGGAGGRGRGSTVPAAVKEDLDKELDEYMSQQSQSNVDDEIKSYLANAI